MGSVDRIARAFIGVILAILAIWVVDGVWEFVLWVFTGIMLLTALIGHCPLYVPFKFTTLKK